MTTDLKTEATKLINQAVFIGQIDSSKRFEMIRIASKDRMYFDAAQSMLNTGRNQLISEFDKYCRAESLEVLKKHNWEYFATLWRAKFLTQPER